MYTLAGEGIYKAAEPLEAQTRAACAKEPDFTDLVGLIAANDLSAIDELYRLLHRGVRFLLARQIGSQEIDDKLHDTFVIVVEAIQAGRLRDPTCLMGFVRTVAHQQISSHIDREVSAGVRKSETVAPSYPVMPVADGLVG